MRKALVTGFAGFIGSRLAARFIAEGCLVIGVDELSTGKKANVPSDAELIIVDLANASTIDQICKDFTTALHLDNLLQVVIYHLVNYYNRYLVWPQFSRHFPAS